MTTSAYRESRKGKQMDKNYTIKDLPADEMPYEKCIRYGAASLSDAELLAAIIRTGYPGEMSIDLARRVLDAGPDSLLNIIYMSIDDLRQIKGIGKVKSVQLKCVGALAKRIAQTDRHASVRLDNPKTIADYYMERLRHEPKEHLMLTMYDSKNMLIKDELLSVGTSNCALIAPADIFRSALRAKAEYIVLLHNHPSGSPVPSDQDIEVTNKVKESGKLIGIPLLDHIIIGDNIYYSFREEGIL